MTPRRVSIVGFGRVGRSLAFLLGSQGFPIRLNIIDPYPNMGSYEDILHSYQAKDFEIVLNDHESVSDSEVIFHCAGPSVPEGSPRLSVTRESLNLTEEIFRNIDGLGSRSPLIIALANPVDLVSLQIHRVTGIEPSRILGTGTLLDTRRFNSLLDRKLGLKPGTSQATILGEHGESMNLWPGGSKIDGKLLAESVELSVIDSVMTQARRMAAYIKSFQGATYYGVSRCALRIWEVYRGAQTETIPVSTQVPAEYRTAWEGEPFWMSLPCRVGLQKVVPVELSDVDRLAVEESARALRLAWKNI